jgi:hypothetical protein
LVHGEDRGGRPLGHQGNAAAQGAVIGKVTALAATAVMRLAATAEFRGRHLLQEHLDM